MSLPYFLNSSDLKGMSSYLSKRAWLKEGEKLTSIQKSGEGNMNCSLRIHTDQRSFILKQGRPWVEKYPTIPAPWGRSLMEGRFYKFIFHQNDLLSKAMPKLLEMDLESNILMLEDLGTDSNDFTDLYAGQELSKSELHELVSFLSKLHGCPLSPSLKKEFLNLEMRKLNHEYMFTQPLRGLPSSLKQNHRYFNEVARLGALYLSEGETLLHGDYYPGSWLRTIQGIRVIDPEFCFAGAAEFDVGVMIAHLILGNPSLQWARPIFELYEGPVSLDHGLALQFAGVEIMRRILGVAQLPLRHDEGMQRSLLDLSFKLVLDKNV